MAYALGPAIALSRLVRASSLTGLPGERRAEVRLAARDRLHRRR
jgi:hypothetical protein